MISTDKCGCKLKLQVADHSTSSRPQSKLKIRVCSRRSPMQVKCAVKEGYNHDSIVTSLITKITKCNVTEMRRNKYVQMMSEQKVANENFDKVERTSCSQ